MLVLAQAATPAVVKLAPCRKTVHLSIVLLLLCAALATACQSSDTHRFRDSRFDVCFNLPQADSFVVTASGIDFDLGRIDFKGGAAKVYIGNFPDYSTSATPVPKTSAFVLVGERPDRDGEKSLFGALEREHNSPLYVMLYGPGIAAHVKQLGARDFVRWCEQ